MRKNFKFEIKELTEEGTFEGLLSPYGTVDQGGDVVERGAYTKTLKDQGLTRPMLWQHKTDEPIGLLTLEDRADGLWCKGELLMELPEGKKAHLLIKRQIVKGLSIGFQSVKDTMEKGIRHLREIKLFEGSIVTFPMALDAVITAVKARQAHAEQKGDFNEELAEQQLFDAGYQMRSALSIALSSVVYGCASKDEAVSAVETIIEQFKAAYLEYIPAYLDLLADYYGDMETWTAKQLEKKTGASISASNKKSIQACMDQIMSAHVTLSALVAEEAAKSTSPAPAAENDLKPEPVVADHSASQEVKALMKKIMDAIK